MLKKLLNLLVLITILLPILTSKVSKAQETQNESTSTPSQPITQENTAETEKRYNIYLFTLYTCPHCKSEKQFLKDLKKDPQYNNIDVYEFEISSKKNSDLMEKVGQHFNENIEGVPYTVIGSKSFPGFSTPETTGKSITEAIQQFQKGEMQDEIYEIVKNDLAEAKVEYPAPFDPAREAQAKDLLKQTFEKTALAPLNPQNLAHPALTALLGTANFFSLFSIPFVLILLALVYTKKSAKTLASVLLAILVFFLAVNFEFVPLLTQVSKAYIKVLELRGISYGSYSLSILGFSFFQVLPLVILTLATRKISLLFHK